MSHGTILVTCVIRQEQWTDSLPKDIPGLPALAWRLTVALNKDCEQIQALKILIVLRYCLSTFPMLGALAWNAISDVYVLFSSVSLGHSDCWPFRRHQIPKKYKLYNHRFSAEICIKSVAARRQNKN